MRLILLFMILIIQKNATFQITDTTLYVPVVTLSKENDTKLLEQLKQGFKRTIKWNKYRSQMTIQSKNRNLNYSIDPTFTNVNRLFVLSFPRNNNTDSRYSNSNYYVPKVEINNFNVLIDPTFTNVNRLFDLSFQRIAGENNATKDYRNSFSHYYVPKVEIKDFNVSIDGKSFLTSQ